MMHYYLHYKGALHIVSYLLKAKNVEPEKQLLLANGSDTAFISRQRLSKHVPRQRIRMEQCNGVFYSVRAKGL
jgi:ParB-like chromosome segregation protein Spo0J